MNPGGGMIPACVSKVELRIECHNLLNKDVSSKSDPCAVLYLQNKGKKWIEVGRTENIQNSLDPAFSKPFQIDYFFEQVQHVRVCVYDIDNATPQLGDDDFLGEVECSLGQIVSSSPFNKPLLLRNKQKAGHGAITIRAEEMSGSNERVYLSFAAKKLDNKDFMGKSDPFVEVFRVALDGGLQMVHRTEVIKNNLNPTWRPFSIPLQTLCLNDHNREIHLKCFDWDSDGSHDYIGGCTTTLAQMLQTGKSQVELTFINPKKQAKKKDYKGSGILSVVSCKVNKEHSFLDFIFGGLQINFTVGIDFTGSNGDPRTPNSLHYIDPHRPNEYMQAIYAVGAVCQDYDSDKMFPALGFGARIPPNNQLSFEFALNFQPNNPFCAGVQGIVDAYRNCLPQIALYGPTNVAPIIYHVARFAAQAKEAESQAYFVLLLLTDGIITDMGDTRKAIVYASHLPMSLIIVGVGGADFSDMVALDGDDGILRAPSGEPVKRDIVQFVPFRDFKNASAPELASHVLAEIPSQVCQYFKMQGMAPKPRPM
ncbi:copine-3-like isoform X2 [Tubulanus polymorphus]|uniref:copine-3-like isoform X2 n=1 Tax=Tubulanus polymorphus TaxID=672921 RepID=UPI003DA6236F